MLYMCYQDCQSPTALGCLNGGSCVADDKKQTLSCSCKAPWTGKNCEAKLGKKTFQEQQCCIVELIYICIPHPFKRFSRLKQDIFVHNAHSFTFQFEPFPIQDDIFVAKADR